MRKAVLSFLFCLFLSYLSAITANKILQKIDENQTSLNRVSTSTMIIHGKRRSREVTAKSWVVGAEKTFSEYLSPPREKGTKMLKLKDKLWIYSPSSDRIIQIAGHMLRQSVMGSDLSYEDFMEDHKLTEIYHAEIEKEEIFLERACWILNLTAKDEKVAYQTRKIWVDKERFLPLKEERFAKSGKLLKQTEIVEVFKISNRWYPKRIVFKDALKKGKGTELIIDSIKFDIEIPEHIFSKASLRK